MASFGEKERLENIEDNIILARLVTGL